jgi:Tfp pilus assembly protein PilN
VLLAILAAIGLIWLLSPLQSADTKITAIESEIASRRGEVKKIETMKNDLESLEKDISVIRTFGGSRATMLNLTREMTTVLPRDTWLSRLRITESTVEIEGYASQATEILPKLEASPRFKKVEFAAPTARDTRLNADRFIIKMEIERETGGK